MPNSHRWKIELPVTCGLNCFTTRLALSYHRGRRDVCSLAAVKSHKPRSTDESRSLRLSRKRLPLFKAVSACTRTEKFISLIVANLNAQVRKAIRTRVTVIIEIELRILRIKESQIFLVTVYRWLLREYLWVNFCLDNYWNVSPVTNTHAHTTAQVTLKYHTCSTSHRTNTT